MGEGKRQAQAVYSTEDLIRISTEIARAARQIEDGPVSLHAMILIVAAAARESGDTHAQFLETISNVTAELWEGGRSDG